VKLAEIKEGTRNRIRAVRAREGMAGRVGVLGCCCCGWLVALILAPIGQAAPTGKLAPERRDKNEWRQAINDWQANENQVQIPPAQFHGRSPVLSCAHRDFDGAHV
jgi:hypothetical protein